MPQPAQPAAAPTPGPWTRNEQGDVVDATGKDVPFRNLTIRMSSIAAQMAEAEANTDLVAASWETAAERDKLEGEIRHIDAVLARRPAIDDKPARIDKILHALKTAAERDRLVEALQMAEEGAAIIVSQISAPREGLSPETTAWVVLQAMSISNRIRTALAAARPPQTTEGAGG